MVYLAILGGIGTAGSLGSIPLSSACRYRGIDPARSQHSLLSIGLWICVGRRDVTGDIRLGLCGAFGGVREARLWRGGRSTTKTPSIPHPDHLRVRRGSRTKGAQSLRSKVGGCSDSLQREGVPWMIAQVGLGIVPTRYHAHKGRNPRIGRSEDGSASAHIRRYAFGRRARARSSPAGMVPVSM